MAKFKYKEIKLVGEENKNFETCDSCTHAEDTLEICILRRCIHAIDTVRDCFKPKEVQDEGKKA